MVPEICGIIVSYNPDLSLSENLKFLLPQVSEVRIIDNGSNIERKDFLYEVEQLPKVTVHYNATNLGIAAALNIGIRYALNAGYSWILTLDQDSRTPQTFIQSMWDAYQDCDKFPKVAIITPTYYDPATATLLRSSKCQNKKYAEIVANMTSGNLVKTSVFRSVGFFREDFFIDYVDYEFCLRLKQQDFLIIQSCFSILEHNRGKMSQHSIFGRAALVTNHAPLRRYYIARNRITVYRNYWKLVPIFLIRDYIDFLADLVKIILFESEKFRKLAQTFLGIYHGIIGKLGPYER